MSSFIHSEKEFNVLAKFFKEVITLDSQFTDHLIFNLYQFELIAVNERYNLSDPAEIRMFKGKEYQNLDIIESYDALKMLDSIKYQASDMNSKVLWKQVEHVHSKLVHGIISFAGLKEDYKSTAEYEMSEWW